jgi:hypothetical protein
MCRLSSAPNWAVLTVADLGGASGRRLYELASTVVTVTVGSTDIWAL